MADLILVDGDKVIFDVDEAFPPAKIIVQGSCEFSATGPATLNGKKICVDGDEKKVSVPATYTTPLYSIPGAGTLKIQSLEPNQKATERSTGGKKVLLKGAKFIATFEVQSPAQFQPPGTNPPQLDQMKQYVGTGSFETTNQKVKGT